MWKLSFSPSSISGKDRHKANHIDPYSASELLYWMSWPCTAIYEQHRLRLMVRLLWEKANVKSVSLLDGSFLLFLKSFKSFSDWFLGNTMLGAFRMVDMTKETFRFGVCFCSEGPATTKQCKSDHLFYFIFLFAVLHCDCYPEFTMRRSVSDVTFAFTFGHCEPVPKAYLHRTKAILKSLANDFSATKSYSHQQRWHTSKKESAFAFAVSRCK